GPPWCRLPWNAEQRRPSNARLISHVRYPLSYSLGTRGGRQKDAACRARIRDDQGRAPKLCSTALVFGTNAGVPIAEVPILVGVDELRCTTICLRTNSSAARRMRK